MTFVRINAGHTSEHRHWAVHTRHDLRAKKKKVSSTSLDGLIEWAVCQNDRFHWRRRHEQTRCKRSAWCLPIKGSEPFIGISLYLFLLVASSQALMINGNYHEMFAGNKALGSTVTTCLMNRQDSTKHRAQLSAATLRYVRALTKHFVSRRVAEWLRWAHKISNSSLGCQVSTQPRRSATLCK